MTDSDSDAAGPGPVPPPALQSSLGAGSGFYRGQAWLQAEPEDHGTVTLQATKVEAVGGDGHADLLLRR